MAGWIGIEWINEYHGLQANLGNRQACAEGFYNTLSGVRKFNFGNDLAWDQDFEESGVGNPPSGTDTNWVDNVDIAYFAGHGGVRGGYFGREDRDSGVTDAFEVRLGNKDLEWMVFDACDVLFQGFVFQRWSNAFVGLHFMLGFANTAHDDDKRGRYFADRLNNGWRVRDAWVSACEETEDWDTDWAYLRADSPGTNTFEDHWHDRGFVSPDPVNPNSFVHAHGPC